MKYIIFDDEIEEIEEGVETLRYRNVPVESELYLRQCVLPLLQPLSDSEYIRGPAQILKTLARFSYILDNEYVYWCIEWSPGLVVVRFAPDASLAQVEIPSPNPQFGGREATREEIESFDEDTPNPQYNLIFDAWDAQLDPEESKSWALASTEIQERWNTALAHVQKLGLEAV